MRKITGDKLYRLCNENKWFTAGSTRQYNILFERSREGASLEELSYIIWMCSVDDKDKMLDRKAIYDTLVKNSYEA